MTTKEQIALEWLQSRLSLLDQESLHFKLIRKILLGRKDDD